MKKHLIFTMVLLLLMTPFFQSCSGSDPETPVVTVDPAQPKDDSEELTDQEEATSAAPRTGIFQGNRAPDFTLYDLEGYQICLEDLRGQKVILNFWQMSCGPCLAEKPEIQAFVEAYGDENVVILSINLRDSQQEVEAYMEENGYTFPVLMDTHDNFAAVEYRVRATPTSVFIDEEGLIMHRIEGAMNAAFMKDRLGIEIE